MMTQKNVLCGTEARISMADAESIERTLGRILTTLDFQNLQTSDMKGDISVIKDSVKASDKKDVELDMMMKALHIRQDEHETRLKKTEDTLEEHESLKNKGLGILSAVAGAMGFLGYVFSNFILPWLSRIFY